MLAVASAAARLAWPAAPRFLVSVFERRADPVIGEARVNGEAGLVARAADTTFAVISFDFYGARVRRVWAVRNPRKLTRWAR